MLLDAKNTLFVCIDLQDRLLPLMAHRDEVVKNANALLRGAEILGIQSLISEQYPRGLGATHADICLPRGAKVLEKTSFGLFGDNAAREFIAQSGRKCLVFFGIEAHICVLQSVVQAVNLGYECVVVGDGVSSRSAKSCEMGLDFLCSFSMNAFGANFSASAATLNVAEGFGELNSTSSDDLKGALNAGGARNLGVVSILPTESILFGLLKDSKHEKFKEISSLVK